MIFDFLKIGIIFTCVTTAFAAGPSIHTLPELNQKIQLMGAIVQTSGGVALIKNRASGQVSAIRVGKDVFGLGVLKRVKTGEATIFIGQKAFTVTTKFTGSVTNIASEPVKGRFTSDGYKEDGLERIGNKTEVDARKKEKMLKEDLPKILMEATAELYREPGGQVKGFVMYNFEEQSSIFGKLGMKNGDVVTTINDVPLTDPGKTIQFLNSLKDERAINVNVIRNGVPVTLELNVK